MSDSMGVFGAATRKGRNTPFEPGIPVSRGGGRHMGFNRVRIIPGTNNFVAVDLKPFPGSFPGDIRSMGPYELPDYSEAHSSAEGIGQIPGMVTSLAPTTPGATPGIPGLTPAAGGAEKPWYEKIATAIPQIYQAYTSMRKPAAPPPPAPSQAFVYNPSASGGGMSTTTIVLLVGGGVAVLGVLGFLLLRK